MEIKLHTLEQLLDQRRKSKTTLENTSRQIKIKTKNTQTYGMQQKQKRGVQCNKCWH